MTAEERLAEILRMTERYKADEERRRVRMVDQPQRAGNAAAIPETPWSSPDLDEFAYLGSPSPPVQGEGAGMPNFSPRPAPAPTPGALDRLAQPYGRRLPEGVEHLFGRGQPIDPVPGEASVRPYEPTMRDRLANTLIGDRRMTPGQAGFVEGALGSRGLGNTGMSLLDLSPVGGVFNAEEELRKGDAQKAALAVLPLHGAVKMKVPPSQPVTPRVLPRDASGQPVTTPEPIRAYHSSPYDFDKFDQSKIGTGQGSQAQGHGLYFAENKEVGQGYRPPGGRTYEVNIREDPKNFLDYDKPLNQQSPEALKALGLREAGDMYKSETGQFIPKNSFPDEIGPVQAERLKKSGIPGVKYLDAGSREAGEGSRNYVLFDTNNIDILNKTLTPRVLARDATGRPISRAPLSETEQSPDEILAAINERLKATGAITAPATGKKRGAITDINLREMPLDEALEVVKTDPHLRKVNPKSDYVGGPEGVRGPKTLQKIRDRFDADVEAGAPGADWYMRAQGGIKELAGRDPTRQSLLSRELALTSAQANPDANLGFALDMHNAYEFGDPLKIARTGQIARTYNQTRDISRQHPMMGHNQGPPLDDVPEIPLGKKTGIYANHMDPTKVNPTTGTNDIWHARAMGYTRDGEPWSAALTPQQHAFLDAETVKAVGRMNEKAVGGRTDWTPGEVQAAPWVTGKARGLKQQRPSLTEEEAMAEAIKSYPEHFDKYTFNQTYELTPGVMTGHRPDIAQGTQQLKEAYANDPRIQWTDPDKRDIINEAIGAHQRPTQRATGLYTPPGGQPEVNPGFVARPMVGLESGGTGVKPRDLAAMKGVQAFRAYMDAQGAGAGSMPLKHAPAGQAGSVYIPGRTTTGGPGERTLAELTALQAKGKPYGLGEVVDYGPGGSVMTDFPPPGGAATGKALRGPLRDDISAVIPGALPQRAKLASVYAGYEDLWGKESGAVTKAMFEHLDRAPPAILQRLDQDPNVRARVLEKMAVDAQSGAPVNTAVQKAREIYGYGGLVGLRKALADGNVKLPAILVAIPGLKEMMEEQDRQ